MESVKGPECPECEQPVSVGDSICGHCGEVLDWAQLAQEASGDPPASLLAIETVDPFAELCLAVNLAVSSPLGERPVSLQSGDRLQIGREVGPLADLCTDNVSGHHADLVVGSDRVEVYDIGRDELGSTNGTFLDDQRLVPRSATLVRDGSIITCGTDPPLTIRVNVVGA